MKYVREMFDMSNKEILKTIVVTVLIAPIIYWGTILLFGLLYAVTGIR